MKRLALTLRHNTVENYGYLLDKHILPVFGHLGIEQISGAAVRDFLAGKLETGLSRHTVVGIRRVLRACLQEAADDGLFATNPAGAQRLQFLAAKEGAEAKAEVKALDARTAWPVPRGRALRAAPRELPALPGHGADRDAPR